METKSKIIMMALVVLLAASVIAILQINSAKKKIELVNESSEKEKEKLKRENEQLSKDIQARQEEVNALNTTIKELSEKKEYFQKQRELTQAQYEDLKAKHDSLLKEKGELQEKLRAASARIEEAKEPAKEPASAEQTDAYWAGVFKAKAALEAQLDNLRLENEQLKREKGNLQLELNNLAFKNSELQQNIDNMAADFVKEKTFGLQSKDTLKALKEENRNLRKELNDLTKRKLNLENKLTKAVEDKDSLQLKFDEMSLFLEEKMSQMDDFKQHIETSYGREGAETIEPKKESVELPPIQVYTSGKPAQISGIVLSVNRDNNFVIINLGKDVNVEEGDTFQVYREGKPIAALEVTQARKSVSACDIKEETLPIETGDTVK